MEFSYQGSIERRKFLRLAKKYSLRHSRYVPINFDDEVIESTTLNISAGGLLFASTEKYDLSELLRLEIEIPDWQKFIPGGFAEKGLPPGGPFAAKGIVTRTEYFAVNHYHIAVSFVGLDRQELWALMFAINKE